MNHSKPQTARLRLNKIENSIAVRLGKPTQQLKGLKMKKSIKLIFSMVAVLSLSACQLVEDSADVASSAIMASVEVDAMQTELGVYVNNQEALNDVDALQVELLNTLATGKGAEYLLSYQARFLIAYQTLKEEALSRWFELSITQQQNLIALDNQLIALNNSFNQMQASAGFSSDLIDLLYRATILMTYYKAI